MVEGHILPTAGVMATGASCTELSAVFIFGGMTGVTIFGRAFIDAVGMTGGALDIGMQAG